MNWAKTPTVEIWVRLIGDGETEATAWRPEGADRGLPFRTDCGMATESDGTGRPVRNGRPQFGFAQIIVPTADRDKWPEVAVGDVPPEARLMVRMHRAQARGEEAVATEFAAERDAGRATSRADREMLARCLLQMRYRGLSAARADAIGRDTGIMAAEVGRR